MSTGAVAARPLPVRVLRRAIKLFDAVTTPTGVDRYVELVRPSWSSTEVRAKVVALTHPTSRSVTLTLRPNGNWVGFQAGQYTQLSVEVDGVQHTRCYSMANAATGANGLIELTATAQPGGLVSPHLRDHVRVGQLVRLTHAQGFFTLPSREPDQLLLISGGSGITPVMSMLRTRCALGWRKPVTFLHYALRRDDMLYRQELEALAEASPGIRLVRVFTEEPGAGDLDGFLTQAQLDAAAPQWRTSDTFVCGPDALMDSARQLFVAAGRQDRFQTEAFTLGNVTAEAADIGGTLLFAGTERQVTNDGSPILQQAERAGLSPQHGCRMGVCHTCTRQLCAGVVRNVVTGELTTGPDSPIRICVNAPVGDVEIDL